MILDASSGAHVDLLRQAALRFRGDDPRVTSFVEAPGALAFVAVEVAGDVIGWCWGYHLVRPDATAMLYLHECGGARSAASVEEGHCASAVGWSARVASFSA